MSTAAPVVLIAEDCASIRQGLCELLRESGYQVIEAEHGQACLERARAARPDLILLDLDMPVMDGWQAALRLRADPETRGVPLLAMTARSGAETRRRALQSGFVALLPKPFSSLDLCAALRQAFVRDEAAPLCGEPPRARSTQSARWPARSRVLPRPLPARSRNRT